MALQYVDNSVPFGSRTVDFKRGGTGAPTTVGTYILESISLSRPSKIIERPNQIGQANGWVAVSGFDSGTAVVQIPTEASEFIKLGDWFEDAFDGTDANPEDEHWVVVEATQPYGMNDYYKQNVTLRLSISPPVA